MATPQEVFRFATEEANRQGVPVDLVQNIIQAESGGNISAKSSKGALGPMQLMPATAKELGVNINDWKDNVRGGVQYIGRMMEQFQDPNLAVAAYNAGPGNVKKYGGIPPFKETQNYVQKVTGMAKQDDEFVKVKGISGAAPARIAEEQEEFVRVKGIGAPEQVSNAQGGGFFSDVATGFEQAIKGGTPVAQAITAGADYLGAALGSEPARQRIEQRRAEAAAQPSRTVGETLKAVGEVAVNRPGLLVGSMLVPDPTSVFLPGRVAGATSTALKTAGMAPRLAERAGAVTGAAATGVAQAGLQQVAAPNLDQLGTDVGVSLLTAPLAAVGSARTPKQPAPLTQEQQILLQAQQQGLKVPPSQLSGSRTATTLESLAGSRRMARQAAEANREVVANQAKQVLGLKPDAELTTEAFTRFNKEQGKAYDALRKNAFNVDEQYNQSIQNRIADLSLDRSDQARQQINELRKYVGDAYLTGSELVTNLKSLRKNGRANMRTADPDKRSLGNIQLFLADQLENLAERNLAGTPLVDNFRQARQNLARSYTLEDAFNAVTQEVSATKLGSKAAKGKLIPTEMQAAARASQVAPGYFAPISQTGGATGVSPTEATAAAAAAMSGRLDLAGMLTGRSALGQLLLSGPAQRAFAPRPPIEGPMRPQQPGTLVPYLTTTPFQPVTQGLFDYLNQ